jgi:hypothetical protein
MTENEPKTLAERLTISSDEYNDRMNYPRELAWQAWREAWNERGSTDDMKPIEERTARTRFERWWSRNRE